MDTVRAAADTPARTRTRNAILRAAIVVLMKDSGASLGEIADAASVARSTLHRYFPERSDLIEALHRYAEDEISAATARARLDEGPASDALIRLCHEYFDQWDTITWSYMESLKQDTDSCEPDDQIDPHVTALIERGYADGTIDPAMPNAWLQQLMWALLYSAWEYIRQGRSKHEALTLALGSLRRLTAPTSDLR